MDRQPIEEEDVSSVVGFEVPISPDSSYHHPPSHHNEDEGRDPPLVPSHLNHTLLNYQPSGNSSSRMPLPQNVILNHLYIENRELPRSVVALGYSHRFRSKGNYMMVAADSKLTVLRQGSGGVDYVRFQPRHGFSRSNGLKECLPKSFWPPPSAPSQYANYYALGSDLCGGSAGNKKP